MSTTPKSHNAGFLALVADAKSRIRHIGIAEYRDLAAKGEAGLLVDVREESEWSAGHAAGAVHIGKGVIERDIESKAPDKDSRMVLYCGGGFRSALVCDALQKMGYTNVISLEGGWRDWRQAGMPVQE